MKTFKVPMLLVTLLSGAVSLNADLKMINSLACAEKIPGAKEIMNEGERIQKTKMGELKDIEQKAQRVMAQIQKERTELAAKSPTMSSDARMKADSDIKKNEREVEKMQADYQRVMHELETDMQMVQMRLQPFIIEAIQNAQEVASKNPSIDAVWDNATKQFVYNKESVDLSGEVIKLTEAKNKDKATTLAKNKPAATPVKAASTKVA